MVLRYLAEDLSTTFLEGHRTLVGYEVYIVEQWACSRIHPTFVITTYTGLPQHKVCVGILSVPTDESTWSPRLRVYLKAISQFHARKKETSLGSLMVTNLNGFPSALTVIAVPGGDVREIREDFILNENLKRLGCSGRAGMNLSTPTGATQAKFYQLYRTSDRVLLRSAVIELVKLCQVALVMFAKLAPEYADGLLCDVTERAINDWWIDIGVEYFNVEPSDGILGPTTVAALLGMLLGARNRLSAYGAPVNKDVFDLRATKRGIAYFQKSQKIDRTRRLDRKTLHHLHRVTSKAANSEGWAVPRAVKSTVAELSGKGGEMVMGMVGGREKTGIAEIETLDITTFAQAVSGERCKWLWQGKPRKSHSGDLFSNLAGDDEMVFSADDTGGYVWSSRPRESVADQGRSAPSHLDHLYLHPGQGSHASIGTSERDLAFRKAVLKSVTGRMSDAKSGLGRFKEAVGLPGLRGHHHKYSRENNTATEHDSPKAIYLDDDTRRAEVETPPQSPREDLHLHPAYQDSEVDVQRGQQLSSRTSKNSGDQELPEQTRKSEWAIPPGAETVLSPGILTDFHNGVRSATMPVSPISSRPTGETAETSLPAVVPPGAGSLSPDPFGVDDHLLLRPSRPSAMQSTQSVRRSSNDVDLYSFQTRWPRHLSFSLIEGSISPDSSVRDNDIGDSLQADSAWSEEQHSALMVQRRLAQLHKLEKEDAVWVKSNLQFVELLAESANTDLEDLNTVYCLKMEEYNSLYEATTNLVTEEKTSLTEALKEFDVLGAKLEYELNALQTRIGDVEDSVADFERQIIELEGRAFNLESEERCHEPWFWRMIEFLRGSK